MLIKLFAFDIFLYLMIFVIGGNKMKCNCCKYKRHIVSLKLDQKMIWIWYKDQIVVKFYLSATSLVTSMGLGTQKGFVANPVHAPPFSILNSLFFCFKNTRCKTLGF